VSSLLLPNTSKALVRETWLIFRKLHDVPKKSWNSKQKDLFSHETDVYLLNIGWSSYRTSVLTLRTSIIRDNIDALASISHSHLRIHRLSMLITFQHLQTNATLQRVSQFRVFLARNRQVRRAPTERPGSTCGYTMHNTQGSAHKTLPHSWRGGERRQTNLRPREPS